MTHNQYKVKFSGMCIMSLASSKKKSIGMWHKKGNRCNSSQIVLMTFAEPTDEIMMQAVQLTNPHLIIDKVSWEFIVFGLGEGGLVGCSSLAECFCPLLPNPCYTLFVLIFCAEGINH